MSWLVNLQNVHQQPPYPPLGPSTATTSFHVLASAIRASVLIFGPFPSLMDAVTLTNCR